MNKIPTEHQEQANLIYWCNSQSGKYPELKLIFAIPNGTNKSMTARVKFKKEGLKSGVPDLFLPVPRNGSHGLFIEMKRRKNSTTSAEQKAWIEALTDQGYDAAVCKGCDEAIEKIKAYLGIDNKI